MHFTHFQAMLVPIAMYTLLRWMGWNYRKQYPDGPAPGLLPHYWHALRHHVTRTFAQVRGDGDGDGDGDGPEPDEDCGDYVAYYEDDPENPARTHIRYRMKPTVLPPPSVPVSDGFSALDRWIHEQLTAVTAEGRRKFTYTVIVDSGAELFNVSRSTVERSIRKVRTAMNRGEV